MEVTLKHTVEEINCILQALGTRPFAEVAELINKIRTSAMSQLAPPVVADSAAPTAPATEEAAQ